MGLVPPAGCSKYMLNLLFFLSKISVSNMSPCLKRWKIKSSKPNQPKAIGRVLK